MPAGDVSAYLAEIELALVSSPMVIRYDVVRSWGNTDDGYIRVRAIFTNGDFLEATEYFALQGGQIATIDYRYQWMDGDKKTLRRRWDSTPHHPEMENFPYHIHLENEKDVIPGESMNLIDLLRSIENEFSPPP